MTKYFIITCNGIQGGNYYRNEKDAQDAAARRNAIAGQNWKVKEVWLYDEYADDDHPYGTMKRA